MVKREIRILGIDDAPFDERDEDVLVIGTIYRGKDRIDGVLSTRVEKDGRDATRKLVRMIKGSKHYDQLRIIMINGIALGGFNIIDIRKLNKETKLPVIVISRKMPDFEKIKRALERFEDSKERWELIERAGEVKQLVHEGKSVYFQVSGISEGDAREVIKKAIIQGVVPEPVRVAHLIATGIVLGESRGRA